MVSLETPPSLESPTSCISAFGAPIHQLFVPWRVQSRCRLRWCSSQTWNLHGVNQTGSHSGSSSHAQAQGTRLRKRDPRVPTCGMPERGSCMPVVSRGRLQPTREVGCFDRLMTPTFRYGRTRRALQPPPSAARDALKRGLQPLSTDCCPRRRRQRPIDGKLGGHTVPKFRQVNHVGPLGWQNVWRRRRVSGSAATLAVRHRLGRGGGGGGMQMQFVTNGTMVIRRGVRCGCPGLCCSF